MNTPDNAAVVANLRAELANATALADKLQHLLNSSRHECEGLRTQIAARNHGACGGQFCTAEPDMETVPLKTLIEAASMFLDDGQSLTIHRGDVVSVNAFGKSFVGSSAEANGLLDASAALLRAEAV